MTSNWITDYLSIAVVSHLLAILSTTKSILKILLLIVLNILSVCMLAAITLLLYYIAEEAIVAVVSSSALGEFFFAYPIFVMYASETFSTYGPIAVLTTTLPAVLHLAISLLTFGTKLFGPLIKMVLGLILLRLSESDKGVLTQLSIGLGLLAKLVQAGFKVYV